LTSHYRLGVLAVALVAAGASMSGCMAIRRNLAPVTPDEFRVVARAPLVVPPDYSLRPPTPGEPRPQELQPEGAARAAMLGASAADRKVTPGERLLMTKAGADNADPLIKFVVDDEFGDLAYKEKSFADMVMFWRPDQPARPAAAAGANTATPIDPAAEAARVADLTGGKPVVIVRAPEAHRRFKLPGL
jgi:hypothetical protein